MNKTTISIQDQAKARFIAAHLYGIARVEYFAPKVGIGAKNAEITPSDLYLITENEVIDYRVQLKKLENITDEHYYEATRIAFPGIQNVEEQCGVPAAKESFLRTMTDRNAVSIQNLTVVNLLGVIEFLRQNGYLLPWNGITCEELVVLGWVQLVEK